MGDRIDHHTLTGSADFPDSYDFYHVRNTGNDDIFVVNHRKQTTARLGKRPQSSDTALRRSKTPRLQSPPQLLRDLSDEAATQAHPYGSGEAPSSSTVRGASVADSLYREGSTALSHPEPIKRTCATCIRLNARNANPGRFAAGRFAPGRDHCMICSIRTAQEGTGGRDEMCATPVITGTNDMSPSARTASPSLSEAGPATYRF